MAILRLCRTEHAVEPRFRADRFVAIDFNLRAFIVMSLQESRESYEARLQADPNNPEVRYALAMVSLQTRDAARAVELLSPLATRDAHQVVHSNLGIALSMLEDYESAITSLRRAVELQPSDVDAHTNLANAYQLAKRHQDAVKSYKEALRLDPRRAISQFRLANSYRESRNYDLAFFHYREALRLDPEHARSCKNAGSLAYRLKRWPEAENNFRALTKLQPDSNEARLLLALTLVRLERPGDAEVLFRDLLKKYPESGRVRNHLIVCLVAQKRHDEAVHVFGQAGCQNRSLIPGAIELCTALRECGRSDEAVRIGSDVARNHPSEGAAQVNLGVSLLFAGQPENAIQCFQRAYKLGHDVADVNNNWGVALQACGRTTEALEHFEQALRVRPGLAWAHLNRAFSWFRQHRFRDAWHEMEWRRLVMPINNRCEFHAMWDGTTMKDGTMLLVSEQGIGDTFHFVRYAAAVRARCQRVVLMCPRKLHAVLKRCPGIGCLIDNEDEIPYHDAYAPLMSLPGVLGIDAPLESTQDPYIFSDPDLVRKWKQKLPFPADFRIGVAWQGNQKYAGDALRSVPLRHFQRLSTIPGVRLLSLQQGHGIEQIAELGEPFEIQTLSAELDRENGAFADTAAIIANLDLVITSDTAIPHLAGAMGKSVWMATSYSPDWRWPDRGPECPWYPSMKLFHQCQLRNWHSVFVSIESELRHLAAR